MTQLESAKIRKSTQLMRKVACDEGVSQAFILKGISAGNIVLPSNRLRKISKPCAIGKGLRTKVNANIGTSTDRCDLKQELEKLKVAVASGADTLMDLSVGGRLKEMRKAIIDNCPVPLGTVPVYEIAARAQQEGSGILDFDHNDMLEVLEAQAREGVDFFTIHAGVTRKCLSYVKSSRRIMGIVSRGGAMLARWMQLSRQENPFYEYFDRILDICRSYDVTLSLGDGLRPGSVLDATDKPQIAELKTLGELTLRCRGAGVQVMVEGPGHVPLDQIRKNILLQKRYCHNAPFYVLGPLVTDVGCGYDHITSAIGGTLAASYGADFLCYVTPSEHLRHPSADDVREGVVASRIAGHAADIVKNNGRAVAWDREMSRARMQRDWKKQISLSIDPEKARRYRLSSLPAVKRACTMCGKFCSIKMTEEFLRA
jgi:phosphomethylpyrimidine synthase